MKRLFVFLAFALALAPAAWAADPQDVANDISREMISPYCPGITLHDCPSDNSHELRRRIAAWAEGGLDKDAIRQRLESEFGENIWATPSTSGSGLWAWVLPIVAAAAGLALVALLATRWTRRAGAEQPNEPEATPEQRRRLDVELAALRDRRG
jgi:cytochrome c-type biogenesis protein CcmH/NrfF